MTFLNLAMLIGLAAVAIPIIIHLLNRQRATIVDWGAMRFLLESLTHRSRRILIEEIILMALRCLVVALLVLAMARPFMPSRTTIPWALVLPALLVAAILAGIAAAMWRSVGTRWILLGVATLLTLSAVGASIIENVLQQRQWSLSGGERDVAILIDGSTSMTIPVDGKPNFERAIEEAQAVILACRPADSVSILLAGPVPRPVVPNPIADREELAQALHDLVATGGAMRVLDSLNAAATSLAEGTNPAKKIVLITDGQRVGWDARHEARWKFLGAGLNAFAVPPQIVCRTLDLPNQLRNAAVSDIRVSRKVVGTDRSVRIDVTIMNTGTTPIEPLTVQLLVDGAGVARQDAGEMLPEAAATVRFDYRFTQPGPHLVTAKVLSEDEMPSDNEATRVVPVIDKLPVLIVEGSPSTRPLDGAAAFVEIALTPIDEDEEQTQQEPQEEDDEADDTPKPDKKKADAEPVLGQLVEPTVVPAPDIASVNDFGAYNLVILANVSRLPQAVATRLVRYVQAGGGLLIIPGDKAVPEFYGGWTSEGGQPFIPATLATRRSLPDAPAHLGLKTLSHPALALMRDTTQSDVERAAITTFWTLDVDEKDQTVRVGGLLDTGEPLLVERRVGKGYVLMTSMSLDRRESNLPSLKCFVPLVHELAYYLSAPALAQTNIQPGSEFIMELPAKSPAAAQKAEALAKTPADVVTPSNRRVQASLAAVPNGLRVTFAGTYEPGLYRLTVARKVGEDFVVPAAATGKGFPFVVLDDASEGNLAPLTDAELEAAGQHVDLFRADSTARLIEAVTGSVPGEELWKYLALALLVGLLAEVGLARWIATQRRMHMIDTVSFGPEAVDVQTFRQRARSLLAVSSHKPEGASKA